MDRDRCSEHTANEALAGAARVREEARLKALDALALGRHRVSVKGPSRAAQWRAETSRGFEHDHERY